MGGTAILTVFLGVLNITKPAPSLTSVLSAVPIGVQMEFRCSNRTPKTLTTRRQRNLNLIIKIQKDLPIQRQGLATLSRKTIEDSNVAVVSEL